MLKQILMVFVLILFLNTVLFGTTPPKDGGPMPDAYLRVQRQNPTAFTFKRALEPWVSTVLANRALFRSSVAFAILGNMDAARALAPQGSPIVAGTRSIPLLLLRFSNTTSNGSGQPLFAPSVLQTKLFDGDPSHPHKTIGDFYSEMSYGLFDVRGMVFDWKSLSRPDTFYEGQDYTDQNGTHHCNGMCSTARIGDLIKETLDLNGGNINWGQFDNDGPDGIPNSGDDDGYVDFVAFVHPEKGGECDRGTNIWSHRWSLKEWTGSVYETRVPSAEGGFIKIDDYTIQPAYGCDGRTPNDIGVFAHEFGHAFGLPDLYDTSGKGQGVGNWCLMSGGSWGGDGQSPDQPVQMSPWAKEVLGWVTPKEITANLTPASIGTYEDNPDVYRLQISPTKYYLINNIGRKLSNSRLPTAGLQVWLVDEDQVTSGLRSNTVNANPDNYGVDLVQADGQRTLHMGNFRGGPGDLFPGTSNKQRFDSNTSPKNVAASALCKIVAPGDKAEVSIVVGLRLCPAGVAMVQPAPTPSMVKTPAAVSGPAPQKQETTHVLEIRANPQRYINKEVQLEGKLENKGANLQLRTGRDFQFSDSSGAIEVSSIGLPFEAQRSDIDSNKTVVSNVLNENVRVIARVESDSETGKLRLVIKNVAVVKE